jgi:hypothetical protein
MKKCTGWFSCAICGACLVRQAPPYGRLEADPKTARMTDVLFDGSELDFTPICLCSAKDSANRRAMLGKEPQ